MWMPGARNDLLRSTRCLSGRGFALMAQRWRTLKHVMISPSRIGEGGQAVLVLAQSWHGVTVLARGDGGTCGTTYGFRCRSAVVVPPGGTASTPPAAVGTRRRQKLSVAQPALLPS